MQGKGYPKQFVKIFMVAGVLFLCSAAAQGQEVRRAATSSASSSEASEAPAEVRALLFHTQVAKLRVEGLHLGLEASNQFGKRTDFCRCLRYR